LSKNERIGGFGSQHSLTELLAGKKAFNWECRQMKKLAPNLCRNL